MTWRASGALLVAIAMTLWVGAAEALPVDSGGAALEFDGPPTITGLKCTVKGPPTEPTRLLGYLDHFVLAVKLKPRQAAGGQAGGLRMAAWFGRLAEGQLDAKFQNPDDRGRPYQIEDASGTLVPPQQQENQTAIAFHPEPSNKTRDRANLSKGIGGRPVPLVPAAAGATTLYSTMHQRFSYSLVAVVAEHAAKYGARYSLDQLGKLPRGIYRLRLPYTVALIDGEKRVVGVVHGDAVLKLDLSAANREATIQSFKGSGAPLVPFE
ncbi:MAG TPA: hypothetical protein VNE39_12845 [Planctomycetota bacterium]|nr:hypothetical protein [Planctomycetota bacterium]